ERVVAAPSAGGRWRRSTVGAVAAQGVRVAEVETELLVRKAGQARETRQRVRVRLAAAPWRVWSRPPDAPRYRSARRPQTVWLVRVEAVEGVGEPWGRLTDWPVVDAEGAARVFRMDRQRWAAEDAFVHQGWAWLGGYPTPRLHGCANAQRARLDRRRLPLRTR